MITVSQLKEVCMKVEREYGSDSKVCIQIRDENGSLKEADYCLGLFGGEEGTLYLTNHKFKHGSYE